MKKQKVKYTDEPIGEIKIVEDFLPKPSELVMKDETVKVTLSLSKESVDFFKKQAERNHSKCQVMIRALVDQYAKHYH